MNDLLDILLSPFYRPLLLGTSSLGAATGALGCWLFLRRESLLGDTMSHAALPGVALAFLVFLQRDLGLLFWGAFLSSLLGSLLVHRLSRRPGLDADAAQALILSGFFGLGILLLSWIQNHVVGAKAGLEHVLFGQAAALTQADAELLLALSGLALSLLALLWNRWIVCAFDPVWAASQGIRSRFWETVFTILIVAVIVVGLSVVGVVLVCALLVAPAAAARQWVKRPASLVVLSALIGGWAGFLGAILSLSQRGLPTGPVVVLLLGAVLLLSLLFSPSRGLISHQLKQRSFQEAFAQERLLRNMVRLGQRHNNLFVEHPRTTLLTMDEDTPGPARALKALLLRGLVRKAGPDRFCLTEKGVEHSQARLTPSGPQKYSEEGR